MIESPRCRDRNYQSYLKLIKLVPSLKDRITDPHEGSRMLYYAQVRQPSGSTLNRPSSYNSYQLQDGANSARSDDISRVKSGVAILLNNRTDNPVNPPLDPGTRDGRGLQNDFTGRLLCPVKYDWDDPV